MKRLLVLFVLIFTAFLSYTVVAQDIGLARKSVEISFPEKIQKAVPESLPAGTYTVGSGGYFPTIDSAFNRLSVDGIAGEVTLELIDNLYTAPTTAYGFLLNGPIPGAGPNSRIIIKPAANKNVTIEGKGQSRVTFLNTSYVTVDGVDLTGATTLTIHAFNNSQFAYNDCVDFLDNSDHNVVKGITFITDDNTRLSCGPGFWNFSGNNVSPDSNLIQYNFIKKAGLGIFISSLNGNVVSRATGNVIKGNRIGSETDSLISLGILTEHAQNTIIENNFIQNLTVSAVHIGGLRSAIGIESYWGFGDIIRNNVIHKVRDSYSFGVGGFGVYLGGGFASDQIGNSNLVYNNMIYDIQCKSTGNNSSATGIHLYYQVNPKIYYNSVHLSGKGANYQGSAALYIEGQCINVEVMNNIFVNTRDESPYRASSVYSYNHAIFTSDNNNLYYVHSPNNCLVRIASSDYMTLSDWQATGKDLNSIAELPNIKGPYLHINPDLSTNIESHGAAISGITTDFDGDIRNGTTPDIGADEFNGAEGIVWKMQQLPENDLMLQVKAVDLSTAWALGLHGKIFLTTDGGSTWKSVGAGLHIGAGITNCIDAISASTAFVGGLNYDPSIVSPPTNDSTFIWRTTDGGVSWQKVFTQLHGFLNAIKMTSATEGISLGDPVDGKFTIIRSTDAGTTWARISTEPSQINNEAGYFRSLCTYGTKYIWFGTYVGNNSSGAVYRSTDAGLSWNRIGTPFSKQVYSVCFIDSLYGICGDSVLSRSTDGGMTWSPITDLPIGHWYNEIFPSVFVAVGNGFWAVVNTGVYKSTDLGVSWNESYTSSNDKFDCASLATVGNVTAGWFTSLGSNISYCRFWNVPTDVHETVKGEIPKEFILSQNYPNPFNPSTTICYSIPKQSHVTLTIFDLLGREVTMLVNETLNADSYKTIWNAEGKVSGVYFYRLKAGEFEEIKKLLLLR